MRMSSSPTDMKGSRARAAAVPVLVLLYHHIYDSSCSLSHKLSLLSLTCNKILRQKKGGGAGGGCVPRTMSLTLIARERRGGSRQSSTLSRVLVPAFLLYSLAVGA
jgi:hypothetical protein